MEYINAIGRRKAAVARVYLKKGNGQIIINDKPMAEYVSVSHLRDAVVEPLLAIDALNGFDVKVTVEGGGVKGQAEAIQLGIARALVKFNEELKPTLKAKDLLTRDPRAVERKKPGLKKARKNEQFSKR